MRVQADRVSVTGPHGTLLSPTSLTVSGGELAIVHGEPGVGVTAFGLALAGRLKPATGTVTVEGGDPRKVIAVVDSPGVSEPDGALTLQVVVGEELELAKRPANKAAVTSWLAEHDAAAFATTRFENLEPVTRTRLLTALAASRKGVGVLVLDTPDRHTSDVDSWARLAREYAERGLAVIVLTATTPVSALPEKPALCGALDQPDPVRCAPVETPAETTLEATVADDTEKTSGDQE
ncbi:ABC transporter ATP-binding protein [Amycolatopsis thailandensis]|uniref:ABC transporter ATP-binding protein n=1 Tax=Amycolatopsis thailandensis TaxID=589330 RepID=A0A229SE06_9PSEU|nr:ABC transporter ATP-binding protein [Amycolatopsis thailandensis]OXM57136.1 ABC transporter ATP-binding protein [Amycolatopsis thailandensis]